MSQAVNIQAATDYLNAADACRSLGFYTITDDQSRVKLHCRIWTEHLPRCDVAAIEKELNEVVSQVMSKYVDRYMDCARRAMG